MYPLKSKSLLRSNQVSIPLFEEAQVLGTPDELEVSHHWVCRAVLTCYLNASASMVGAGVCADTTICMSMPSRSP